MWTERLAPAVANPGRWAVLAESEVHIPSVTQIKNGCGGFKKGDFDAVSRKCDDGLYRLFVMYLGAPISIAA